MQVNINTMVRRQLQHCIYAMQVNINTKVRRQLRRLGHKLLRSFLLTNSRLLITEVR
jgi:hypothetical protein